MTERLAADEAGVERAASVLRAGGLVAFPTDTVYGVGCRWVGDPLPRERLFQLKQRPVDRRVPVLVDSLQQAVEHGYEADDRIKLLTRRFWPGALTIVLPFCADAPAPEGAETQAFRAPDHPVALALIGAVGPLYVSSANLSGQPEALTADEVLAAFAGSDLLDAVVDGGRAAGGRASTVVDLSVSPARLLREGAVGKAELEQYIAPLD